HYRGISPCRPPHLNLFLKPCIPGVSHSTRLDAPEGSRGNVQTAIVELSLQFCPDSSSGFRQLERFGTNTRNRELRTRSPALHSSIFQPVSSRLPPESLPEIRCSLPSEEH